MLGMDILREAIAVVQPKFSSITIPEDVVVPLFALFMVVASATIISLLIWGNAEGRRVSKVQGEKAMRLSRQQVLEDAIVMGIEDAVFNNKMTRRQAKARYREMGQKMGLNGLILQAKEFKKLNKYRLKDLRTKTKAALADPIAKIVANLPREIVKPKTNGTAKLRLRTIFAK